MDKTAVNKNRLNETCMDGLEEKYQGTIELNFCLNYQQTNTLRNPIKERSTRTNIDVAFCKFDAFRISLIQVMHHRIIYSLPAGIIVFHSIRNIICTKK